jgi:hypothetical protein
MDLPGALNEIGRVVKSNGRLFVAVPDATTISDRLYRWLARGGGHVNPFSSASDLATKITRATGLRLVATRTLCTSLSYLNRCNRRMRAPRRLLLLGGGTQISLHVIGYLLRLADRLLKNRASVYGWALYFGGGNAQIDSTAWTNICVRRGAAHPSSWLLHNGMLSKSWCIFATYRCPACRAQNLFTDDRKYLHLSQPRFKSQPQLIVPVYLAP